MNSLERSELENTISVLKGTVKTKNLQIHELTQLNAALASTQLDAVNRLELEIERLNEIIDIEKELKND
jgi:hypothetical protein